VYLQAGSVAHMIPQHPTVRYEHLGGKIKNKIRMVFQIIDFAKILSTFWLMVVLHGHFWQDSAF
jgi:hypothetical protein